LFRLVTKSRLSHSVCGDGSPVLATIMALIGVVSDRFVEKSEVVARGGKHRVLFAQVLASQVTSDGALQHRIAFLPPTSGELFVDDKPGGRHSE
jgi:hypothetical protein